MMSWRNATPAPVFPSSFQTDISLNSTMLIFLLSFLHKGKTNHISVKERFLL